MNTYNKENPFFASISNRYSLSKKGSQKNTHHIVLDLRQSGLSYEVGDSVGIFSNYDPEIIHKTLEAMKASGNEKVLSKKEGKLFDLKDYLKNKVSLNDVPLKLIKEIHKQLPEQSEKKILLDSLLLPENYHQLKSYLSGYEVWDFLLAFEEVQLSHQTIVDSLLPHLPRFYSIASSQKYVGDEVHLTVAPLEYESRGHTRRGVCTHFLCSMLNLNDPSVPLFIQPSHGFRLPENPDTSIIMIGPGTGVAPFRAFMHERILQNGKGKNWLFFGEQQKSCDFFYEEEWLEMENQGKLILDVAFSRDQENKIYVQHKMIENGAKIFEWLEHGAYIYVCGDASRMAKDVENALLLIIQEQGQREEASAKEYLKSLRNQKRYLKDVY